MKPEPAEMRMKMKEKFQIAYLPIGVPTFHLESAKKEFEKSIELLKGLSKQVVTPDEMLLSIEGLEAFLDTIEPSLVVIQNITFANAAYASTILKRCSCPILLWTLREPVIDGGRLRLNSLTGAYSAANAMHEFGRTNFFYVYGGAEEEKVKKEISAVLRAVEVKQKMQGLKMAAVGHTPQGFGFGRALDLDLLKTFGVELEAIEARELIDRAKSYSEESCRQELEETKTKVCGMEQIPEKNQLDYARLYRAYREYVEEHQIGALATRCWPDFFTAFGTPVCTVLAILNDLGIPAACEADIYGALSMYMTKELTGCASFFGDPVSLDEKENTITYWHCGTAACSLANKKEGAQIGVHCNRKIGPTLDFGCRPCEAVTVFRVGRKPDGTFRFFVAKGEALDVPKQFTGTSVVVKMEQNAEQIVKQSVKDGWEPHFVVAYGDIAEELKALAQIFQLEICEYRE